MASASARRERRQLVCRNSREGLVFAGQGNGGGSMLKQATTRSSLSTSAGHFCGVAVVVMLVVVVGYCASGASASIVGLYSWQPPLRVTSSGLSAISCPSISLCVATDSAGDVVTSTEPAGGAGSWQVAHIDTHATPTKYPNGAAYLDAISCPSVSMCVAFDDAGYVFWSTNLEGGAVTWSSAKISDAYSAVGAVSCPTVSLCVAVGHGGEALIATDPTGGAAAWSAVKLDTAPCPVNGYTCHYEECRVDECPTGHYMTAISCPSVSLCVAGDENGNLSYTEDPIGGASAWSTAYVDRNTQGHGGETSPVEIKGVACPSVSLCLVKDSSDGVIVSQSPTGGPSAWRSANGLTPYRSTFGELGKSVVACPSVSRCVSVSETEAATAYVTDDPLHGPIWTASQIDAGHSLTGLACPSETTCVAVDNAGNVVVGEATTFSRTQLQKQLKDEITPHGSGSRIGALLAHRGCPLQFNMPSGGDVRLRWLFKPIAKHSRALLLAARSQYASAAGGPVTIRLNLSEAAIARLRHTKALRLVAEGVFSPVTGPPIRATQDFTLRR